MRSSDRELRLDGPRAMRVLDAAYRLDLADDALSHALTAEVAATIDDGAGVHSFEVDLWAGGFSNPRLHGGDPQWDSCWREAWWDPLMMRMDTATLLGFANFGPLSYTRDLFVATARAVPTFGRLLDTVGIRRGDHAVSDVIGRYPDSLNLIAVDANGKGFGFCANRVTPADRQPTRTSVDLAGLIAAHVAAGVRLRASRRREHAPLDDADALFTDRGDVVHVRSGAGLDDDLGALGHAARSVVRTKAESRDDADGRASLTLWQVLFARSYSVVDTFDRDGRRYLVANRNRPTPDASIASMASRLSRREAEVVSLLARGHSNKLIAYELDISASTVANHVASATRKLGLGGTTELVAMARAGIART